MNKKPAVHVIMEAFLLRLLSGIC